MDKKKVKELIEQAVIWSRQANQYSVISNLEEALKELNKSDWVSVEDGLPPYGEEVFVTGKMAPDNVFKNRRVESTTVPTVMDKTKLHASLLFLMLKLKEARSNRMSGKNFVAALTEVLRFFRDDGELKEAYESQKDSFIDLTKGNWAKWIMEILASKTQEDGVDVELPNIDALIKECTSDEFIEKKINDIPGDDVVDKENKEQL